MKRICIMLCLILMACDDHVNPIPNYPVRINVDLTFRDKELRDVPSSKVFTLKNINVSTESVGFGGVLVVHAIDDQYYAFDLSCPHEANRSTLVEADENTLNAVCPKCGTKYDIGFGGTGAPNGVSKYYLKRYNAIMSGSTLIVSN